MQLLEKHLAEAHNLSAQCDGGRQLIMATAVPSSPTSMGPSTLGSTTAGPSLSSRASPSGGAAEPSTPADAGEVPFPAEPPATTTHDVKVVKAHPEAGRIPHTPPEELEGGHVIPTGEAEGWASCTAAAAASFAFSAATADTAAASAAISGGSDLTASPVKPNKGPGGGDGASSAAAAIRGGFALASDIAAGLLFPGLLVAGAGAYGGVSGAGWGSYSGQGEWRGEWQGEWAALNANLLSWGELAVPCSIAPSPHPSPPFTTPPSHPFS